MNQKDSKLIFIATNQLGSQSAEATHNVEMAVNLNKLRPIEFIGGQFEGEKIPDQLKGINHCHIITCKSKSTKRAHFEYEKQVLTILKKLHKECPTIKVYLRYRLTGFFLYRFLIKNKIPYYVEYNDKTVSQLLFFGKFAKSWSKLGTVIRTNRVTLKIVETYEKWVFSKAKCVRVVTPQLESYVRLLTNNNVNVVTIPNGTNTDKFKPKDKITARQTLGLPKDRPILIHIGSLTPWDGVAKAIDVLVNIPEALLVVVGRKNAYYRELQQQVNHLNLNSQVLFTGQKTQDDISDYIAAADIGLLLKEIVDYGLSPIKYYEYMACGIPIISTDVPLINHVTEDQCGEVVSYPIQQNQLCEKIKKIIDQKNVIEKYGRNARQAAITKYTWEKRAMKLHEVIT